MPLTTPWPICATCKGMPTAIFRCEDNNEPYRLWPSFSLFATSAISGCHTCTLFHDAIYEPFKDRLGSEPVYLQSAANSHDATLRVVYLTVDIGPTPDGNTEAEPSSQRGDQQAPTRRLLRIADIHFVVEAKDIPRVALQFQDMISLRDEDENVLTLIKQHLANCLSDHNYTCDRVIFPLSAADSQRANVTNIVIGSHGLVVAPTRLICVGSENQDDPTRLVDGAECLQDDGHLVLSYCWGMTPPDAPWRLTTQTMQQFSTEIPLRILPQTLHDAIMWTRKLGERFIWIDSMCILQDDTEDWEREASRMASIYSNATMTLVAASSSVYGGISDRRNPLRSCAARLEMQGGDTRSAIYVLPNGQPQHTAPPPPTGSRAWCYQEDLLSSRIAILSQQSLQWQCVGDGSKPSARAQGLEALNPHPPYRWYTIWYRLVERYSSKSLSYSKDKLRAFFGVGCSKAGPNYLAGVLKNDPWVSLLWCRDEMHVRQRPGRRYEQYVAPSWSWANIDAPVRFYEAVSRSCRSPQLPDHPMDPQLHHIEVQRAGLRDTGAVEGGRIELSAHIVVARTGSVEPFIFNTKRGPHTYGRRNIVDPFNGNVLGIVVFDIAEEAADAVLLCCVLLHISDISLWEKNGTAGIGLALRIQEATLGTLSGTRVGYVQFTSAFYASSHRRRVALS